jgi:hypothetical protein
MKLFIPIILIIASAALQTVNAQQGTTTTRSRHTTTTTHTHRYFYYPSSNIYFDPASQEYFYYDTAVIKKWTVVKNLPAGILVDTTGQQVIYHDGGEIWIQNPEHVKTFRVTRKGVKPKAVRD